MPSAQNKALASHRRRLKAKGLVRLEVKVHKADARLLREVVSALANPALENQTRAFLRAKLRESKAPRLKALLAAAPLEGVDLGRETDLGRDIKL